MVLYPRLFSLSKSNVKNNRTLYFSSWKQLVEDPFGRIIQSGLLRLRTILNPIQKG